MSRIANLKNQIKTAIESTNDIKLLDKILSNDSNLNELKSYKYFDVYVHAIKLNKLHLIKYFYSKGFPINCIFNTNKRKHVEKAVNENNLDEMNDNKNDEAGDDDEYICKMTSYSNALIEAIKCQNLKAIKLLIDLNVDLNSTDYKRIPIQIAYNLYQNIKTINESKVDLKKCYNIMKLMLKNNANPNIYNNDGLRLIHQVILDKNLEIVKLLLNSANLNVNVLTYGKMQNALHLVSETRRIRNNGSVVYYCGDEEVAFDKEIASEKVDDEVAISDDEIDEEEEGRVEEINLKLARLLIKAGCNMNHRDYNLHETPIFKAIVQNDYNLVKLFVTEGIDISLRNVFGNDALSRSVQLGRFKIARLLIDIDAQIRKSTCFYKMPRNDEINKWIFFNQQQSQSNDFSTFFDEIDFTRQNIPMNNNNNANHENILMISLNNYEEFLKYLKIYTNDRPRSLVDLARLKVRKLIRKPISNYVFDLKLPKRLYDLILLKDIE